MIIFYIVGDANLTSITLSYLTIIINLLLNFGNLQITNLTNSIGSTKVLFKSNKNCGLHTNKITAFFLSNNINDNNQEQSKV